MFFKTAEQKKRYEQIGQLADQFSKRAQLHDLEGSFPIENINDLKQIGYTTLTLPVEFGGKGASLYEFILLHERLAQGCGPTALSIGWHVGIILDLATTRPWSKDNYAAVMAKVKENALLNRAATEAQTGSPTRGGKPQTTAVKDGDQWRMNGRKTFTTMAPALDFFLVSAAIEGSEDVGEFLVPRDTPGVRIEETWDSIAMRATESHDLILENVTVEEDHLLEMVSSRPKNRANGWLLHIPACYLGIAQAACNYAIQFARSYQPNSLHHPIIELPNVQRQIGEMELKLKHARHFLLSVADNWDELTDKTVTIPDLAAAKHVVTNSAIEVVDQAMRVVGARSLSEKNPLQRYYRDVRAGLHNPPMDDATIQILAQSAIQRSSKSTRSL
ncbi:acyl-CoA dehydrogenase family protein [Alkalihalobacterium chitinilyticum]|uniref:Acyl-CoA/acyl-ACP dehydrogenase n=1 Tax=Alkalihalobacterium chitinilyticum TaxID=2980103 RepID=A0ABT5VBA2_9BACI|nr:acyl-CoA dehydrogenase family protein [Alkalihalobacterium chitinilyticum]MDE5412743.1 acyl-CoA/acyl-ACP dehydrogenase [Alkalihalobacterium chitinilyticum]